MGEFRRRAEEIAAQELGHNPPSATGWFVSTRAVLSLELSNPYFAALNNMSLLDVERLRGDTVKDGISVVFREPGKKGGTAKINPKMTGSLTSNDGGKTTVTIPMDDPKIANMADAIFQGSRNQSPTIMGYTRLDSLPTTVNATPQTISQNAPVSAGAPSGGSWTGGPITNFQDLSAFAEAHGFEVTSTNSGEHNKGSKHYLGLAIDVRTRDRSDGEIAQFMSAAQQVGIRVVDERTRPAGQAVWGGEHLHLEVTDASRRLPPATQALREDTHSRASSNHGMLPKNIDPNTGKEFSIDPNDGRNHQGGNARTGTVLRGQRELNSLAQDFFGLGGFGNPSALGITP